MLNKGTVSKIMRLDGAMLNEGKMSEYDKHGKRVLIKKNITE